MLYEICVLNICWSPLLVIWIRIAFNFLLKILMTRHHLWQCWKWQRTIRGAVFSASLQRIWVGFNPRLVLIDSYTQSLQHIKKLPPPCNLNNEQLCTLCSNPNKPKFLRDYVLQKLVLVVSKFPLYSQISINLNSVNCMA